MPDYRVTWEIDIEAPTPEEAARLAHAMRTDPDSTATVYAVRLDDGVEVDAALVGMATCSRCSELYPAAEGCSCPSLAPARCEKPCIECGGPCGGPSVPLSRTHPHACNDCIPF